MNSWFRLSRQNLLYMPYYLSIFQGVTTSGPNCGISMTFCIYTRLSCAPLERNHAPYYHKRRPRSFSTKQHNNNKNIRILTRGAIPKLPLETCCCWTQKHRMGVTRCRFAAVTRHAGKQRCMSLFQAACNILGLAP